MTIIPKPLKDAVSKLDLPQSLLLQGILLDHSLKLVGIEKAKESKIIS